ncbi:ubiquinol-cytochrome c reductase cytochrome b subunit [Leifsonia sp. Leaf336]|uniref:cytochrome b n=1 Tax=Leifsonia sp. Leaf336 TaxID=1736341 RepID=UPI0006FB4091|nr:cytochrome b N-terminal domain-containing protein [Leifsonia sp. Leaf336]KQR51306.1 ubiquinol-cytochrome c reductase cytochrome b subunit [Leifsonia sp. Leaf336]
MRADRRPRRSLTESIAGAARESGAGRRLAAARAELAGRRVSLHWSNLFGVVALACVVVLIVTGLLLMFWYAPSSQRVTYAGSYAPLAGQEASAAFVSILHTSFDIPGGLLVRQAHHWAALLLPATIMVQLAVTFFTGAFRRRRGSWLVLFGLLIVALAGGWSGYALPDDMLSGTGLRIFQGILLGIPVVGTWLSWLFFGGEFPGRIIENLYPVHIAVVPALLIGLLWLRARLASRQEPTRYPGEVGVPAYPNAAVRAGGLFAIVTGLLVLVAATVTIAPVWLFGPSSTGDASAGSQPDWYTGFLDGALRLVPPGWEFVWLGRTWTLAILVPLAVVGVFLLAVAVYPFFEQWVRGPGTDDALLDRPRNEPTRTALGVAGVVFYGALWGAGSADLVATHFSIGLESVVHAFQGLVVLGPVAAFFLTRRVCLALQKKDRGLLLHGYETGRIVRLPGGEYVEVHAPVPADGRLQLAGPRTVPSVVVRPDQLGRVHTWDRLRARLARAYLEDRLEPAAPGRIGAAAERDRADEATAERAGAA